MRLKRLRTLATKTLRRDQRQTTHHVGMIEFAEERNLTNNVARNYTFVCNINKGDTLDRDCIACGVFAAFVNLK